MFYRIKKYLRKRKRLKLEECIDKTKSAVQGKKAELEQWVKDSPSLYCSPAEKIGDLTGQISALEFKIKRLEEDLKLTD